MPIDPVCGMVVEEDESYSCTDYKGKRYCFCSESCKEEFEENPEDYVTVEKSMESMEGL